LLRQPRDAHFSDIEIDIMENIWCISFFTALIFSGFGATIGKLVFNSTPGNLFLNWIAAICASAALNAAVTFPMSEQGFLVAMFMPLILFGSKTFRSKHEDEAVVLWIAAFICIVICSIFPWIMSILVKIATFDYGLVYWQVVFIVAIAGAIYAYGAIYYTRLARNFTSV